MRGKSTKPRTHVAAYFICLFGIYLLLLFILYRAIMPTSSLDWIYWFILAVPLVPIAYISFHFILTVLFFRNIDYKLEKVPKLDRKIRVALILGVFNDFIEEPFIKTLDAGRVGQPENLKIDFFIASDSTDKDRITQEKEFANKYNVHYLHRDNRHGQRPGAINDWAKEYLKDYNYFMILDKDSVIVFNTTISRMVRAMEHPDNNTVAIIQSSMINASTQTRFSNDMGILLHSFRVFSPKNDMIMLGKSTYWGHNALIRREAYSDVGGFSEDHLCDDMIFTMALDKKGWRVCYCTDLITYEYFPPDFLSLRERTNRWARANFGTVRFVIEHFRGTSLPILFFLIMPTLGYILSVFLFIILVSGLVIPSLVGIGILNMNEGLLGSVAPGLFIYLLSCSMIIASRFLTIVSPKEILPVLKCSSVDLLMSMNVLPSLVFTTITYPIFRSKYWNPATVVPRNLTLRSCFWHMRYEFSFGVFLLAICLFLQNWFWMLVSILFLLNFFTGPYLCYVTHKPPTKREKRMTQNLINDIKESRYIKLQNE